jgi:hypothetical protein
MTPQTLSQRPTIKILLYTDDPDAITDRKNLLGLSSMIERLKAHPPMFADLSIKWVSRNSDYNHHADNKLDLVMTREVEQTGEPFDEIWFFGLHQGNTDKFSLGVFPCGPESELNADEVAALDKWMKAKEGVGGGVLMTGDHNNPILQNHLKNTNGPIGTGEESELLGLGRAIGRGVPRAGQLRKWEGAPSSRDGDRLDTLGDGFQTDRVPQKLIHELVNEDGGPDSNGEPHPLFFYRSGGFIDIFPDHRHEGALVIPDLSNTELWPIGPNGQPKPCVVGFGTDSKSGQRIGLVSAYDGDGANVGRIVADSSWHHYVNINLKGFPHPAPPGSFSDQLGQFYSNLAIWLAPMHKRRQMAQAMCWELARYTLLLEPQGDPLRIGEIAYSVLARSTSRCETHELLRAFHEQQATLRGSVERMRDGTIHTPQEILGSVLKSIQKEMIRAEEGTVRIGSFVLESIVTRGLTKARVTGVSSASNSMINVTNQSKPGGQKSTMTSPVENKEWTIEMSGDSQSGKSPFSATLVFRLNTQDGIVTGEVWEGVEPRRLSKVSGTHQPLPSDAHWFISLDFQWGDVNITLSGVTLETSETVLFNGRYRVTAAGAVASRPVEPVATGGVPVALGRAGTFARNGGDPVMPLPPGDGDTGSGTGQQT